jgi:hypothetical protein
MALITATTGNAYFPLSCSHELTASPGHARSAASNGSAHRNDGTCSSSTNRAAAMCDAQTATQRQANASALTTRLLRGRHAKLPGGAPVCCIAGALLRRRHAKYERCASVRQTTARGQLMLSTSVPQQSYPRLLHGQLKRNTSRGHQHALARNCTRAAHAKLPGGAPVCYLRLLHAGSSC